MCRVKSVWYIKKKEVTFWEKWNYLFPISSFLMGMHTLQCIRKWGYSVHFCGRVPIGACRCVYNDAVSHTHTEKMILPPAQTQPVHLLASIQPHLSAAWTRCPLSGRRPASPSSLSHSSWPEMLLLQPRRARHRDNQMAAGPILTPLLLFVYIPGNGLMWLITWIKA